MSAIESISPHSQDGELINWHRLLMIAKRHYWLFLAIFIPVVLITFAYVLLAHPIYQSTATVQVELRVQSTIQPIDKDEAGGEDLSSEDSVKTIEQNMQSYDLFEAVASNPDIANDPDFLVGYSGKSDPPRTSDLADWLQANTTIAIRRGTRLIDVTVDHRVPTMAQKLAQALVSSYVLLGGEAQTAAQQAALKLLSSESAEVKQNLQKSESALEVYKDLLDLKKRIDDQQTVIDGLKERYREKHPQMIEARGLLANLYQDFDTNFQRTIGNSSGTDASTDPSKDATTSLDDRVSIELRQVEARSSVLQTEVDTESGLFDSLLKQMRETDVSQDSSSTEISLVEPPVVPTKPSKPRKTVIVALGVAMGLFLGLGTVIAVHTLESTIETPLDAETALGLPALGTIMRAPSRKKGTGAAPPAAEIPVVSDPGGAAAEGFRSLRAVINLLGKPSEHRTILFTSALPGEGKTFVSCNYAVSLAQTGVRTLLVDTDLRRPEVHNRFKLDLNMGFTELVTQDLALSQVVHAQVFKNLDVLTAGGECPNPAELLAGSGFKELLAKALASYDRVVFDTSPVNLVSDTLLIAPEVDSICLVIRAGSTSKQAPRHALALLRRAHKEPSGIILNAIPPGGDRLYLGYKGRGGVGSYGKVYSRDS